MNFLVISLMMAFASPLQRCHPKGVDTEAQCANVAVMLPSTKQEIDLHVVVLPAIQPKSEAAPLFFLAGGPGQGAAELVAVMEKLFHNIRVSRDIVFVDQRGTGQSNALRCEETDQLTDIFVEQINIEDLQACLQALTFAPQDYVTSVAADDLEVVRKALAYDKIDLYGVSYGTRLALDFMRRHPSSVGRVVLDGVAPPQLPIGGNAAKNAQQSWLKIVRACTADKDCSEKFPKLEHDLLELLAALPQTVEINHPRSHTKQRFMMQPKGLLSGINMMLYSASTAAKIPFLLAQAKDGNWAPFVAQVYQAHDTMKLSIGMYLSVVCSEDFTRLSEPHQNGVFANLSYHSVRDACAHWPKVNIDAGFFAPVVSDIPTLLLSGELDPVTPPSHAEEAIKTLRQAKHIVMPHTGHNAIASKCGLGLVKQFLEVEELDTACVSKLPEPTFLLDFYGPKP